VAANAGSYQLKLISGLSSSGRSVCLIPQPRATDQGEDPLGVLPPTLQDRNSRLAKLLDGLEDAVAQFVLDEIPELLTGVELRAVGRQVDDPDVGRQAGGRRREDGSLLGPGSGCEPPPGRLRRDPQGIAGPTAG